MILAISPYITLPKNQNLTPDHHLKFPTTQGLSKLEVSKILKGFKGNSGAFSEGSWIL